MTLWIFIAFVAGALLGGLVRHFSPIGVGRALKGMKLMLLHSQQSAASKSRSERAILRLLIRGDVERAVERLARNIAIFYHSWKSNPDLVKDAEPIQKELAEIEQAATSIPCLEAAIKRESLQDDSRL